MEPLAKRKFAATREDVLVEQSLIEKAQHGDNWAVAKLYETHLIQVRRLLVSILGPTDQLEDLSQDVFIQVFQSLPRFRGKSRFSTWVHRITINTAISWLRRQKNAPRFTDESYPPCAETATAMVQIEQNITALYEILSTLSPKRRVAFTLYEIEDFTISEIAEMTHSNIPTIKSRLFFARQELLKKAANHPILQELIEQSREGQTP